VGVKSALRQVLPESAHNVYRRFEESRTLSSLPATGCDVRNLAREQPTLQYPSDWGDVERRADFGESRGQAVNTGDQRLIYCLTRALRPRAVLEIGTNVGGSAVMFSLAIEDGAHLTTVDIVDVNGPSGPAARIGCRTPAELIKGIGRNNVSFVTSRSIDYLRTCRDRYDLIFLDGAHEADVVYQEVPLALQLLNPGGRVLLHDYFPNLRPLWSNGKVIPGPWLAIQRLRKEGAPLRVMPFGQLPWPTKLGSNVTSLALLLRA
jgi:predicted O-methyltransferase YrrM